MSVPLKVLVLADGSSIHTEQWIRGLTLSGGIDVSLVTVNAAGIRPGISAHPRLTSSEVIGRRAVAAQGGNYHYLLNLPRLRRSVARIRPDIITTIYLTSYGVLGALCKGDALLCHFMVGTDIMVAPGRGLVNRLATHFALARGDYFVSASATMTKRLLELRPIPQDRLLTQQYGIGDDVIDHPARDKEYDLVSNRAWVPNSNIPELLGIIAKVPAAPTLALIGNGGPQEEEIADRLRAMPRVLPLGILPHTENIDTVARSRFYLSLTSSDGASLSLMEAMAVGAIPVVSDIGPNREWVQEGENGFLLPLGDPDAAARKLEKILFLPEVKCATMRDKNRRIIRERGSLSVNMRRLVENLQALSERRGRI